MPPVHAVGKPHVPGLFNIDEFVGFVANIDEATSKMGAAGL